MEPTANYHKPLGEYLTTQMRIVVLVSGVTVKRNRELLDGRWDKHEVKNSANAADLISQRECSLEFTRRCKKQDPVSRDLNSTSGGL